jgi:predicted amidohydrolase YtcJ
MILIEGMRSVQQNKRGTLMHAGSRMPISRSGRRVLRRGCGGVRCWPLFLFCLAGQAQQADVIYYNGKITTVWDQRPAAQAVAISGDRFVAVGSDAEVLRTAGPGTRKIDLRGYSVLPGLIDGHVHPISAALTEIDGPLPVFQSVQEIQTYIREQSRKLGPGKTIFVPKVYSTRLREHRYPTRREIDDAAGGHDAIVDNGYAAVLSSSLLKRLGITSSTPQPVNGRIVKDRDGELTGLIVGAPQLLEKARSTRTVTPKDRLWALKSMLQRYNTVGITGIIDRGENAEGFRAYQALHDSGELSVRSYVTYLIKAQGTPDDVRREIEQFPFVTGWGDKWLRVGSLKTIMDGGILIGTAYLREPYGSHMQIYGFEEPGYRGVLNVSRQNIFAMASIADELGWQMTAHVTGGGSLDILLDAYEAANRNKPLGGRRFVVTHANFPNQRAIERAKRLGVGFDVQPQWLYLDGPAIQDTFGTERMKDFIPLRSLISAGVVAGGGSDHMTRFDPRLSTNPYHPFSAMWMAITRRMVDGNVLNPGQRISRLEALKMWTLNNAYLMFAEKDAGSIQPGKLADLVVIAQDFMNCPEESIKDIEPVETLVGGRVVYDHARLKSTNARTAIRGTRHYPEQTSFLVERPFCRMPTT